MQETRQLKREPTEAWASCTVKLERTLMHKTLSGNAILSSLCYWRCSERKRVVFLSWEREECETCGQFEVLKWTEVFHQTIGLMCNSVAVGAGSGKALRVSTWAALHLVTSTRGLWSGHGTPEIKGTMISTRIINNSNDNESLPTLLYIRCLPRYLGRKITRRNPWC